MEAGLGQSSQRDRSGAAADSPGQPAITKVCALPQPHEGATVGQGLNLKWACLNHDRGDPKRWYTSRLESGKYRAVSARLL